MMLAVLIASFRASPSLSGWRLAPFDMLLAEVSKRFEQTLGKFALSRDTLGGERLIQCGHLKRLTIQLGVLHQEPLECVDAFKGNRELRGERDVGGM